MRLLLHNLLECKVKGCKPSIGYPLLLQAVELKINSTDYNAEFVKSLLPKINYGALLCTLSSIEPQLASLVDLQDLPKLPETLPEEPFTDEFLKGLHKYLLEVDVVNGQMVCKGCNHVYPVTDSIPNMLLKDEES